MNTNNIKPANQPPTRSILNLNEKWLDSALRKLSPKIFQSEAQLQFELAWNIKQNFNCNVFLEDLTAYETDSKGNITHKLYTDIVVEDIETNYRIGIELKYKTAELKYNNIYLFNHGALPLNRYDYLWDVNRLESLVYNKPLYNNATSTTIVKPCDVGFAIILTNEKNYWMIPNPAACTIDKDFRIHQGKNLSGKLNWNPSNQYPSTVVGTKRAQPICLKDVYNCDWMTYLQLNNVKNGDFHYMIISIPSNAQNKNITVVQSE